MRHETFDATAAAFTAVVVQDGAWWIGWIAEMLGVNAQEPTRDALIDSLREALGEALDMNRADARAAAGSADYDQVEIAL